MTKVKKTVIKKVRKKAKMREKEEGWRKRFLEIVSTVQPERSQEKPNCLGETKSSRTAWRGTDQLSYWESMSYNLSTACRLYSVLQVSSYCQLSSTVAGFW